MPEDTNQVIDTAEAEFDQDFDEAIDETLDDEEDLEVTFTGEDDEGAEDTNSQPEDAQAEEGAKAEEAAVEMFALKYKGQENQYTREQLLELAQKGLDYDGLRADRDRLRDNHPALAIIDRYAKRNGMTREQYMEFAAQKADEAEVAPVIQQLMESGAPEAVAKELALRRLQEQRGAETRAKQEQETQEKQTKAQQAEAQKKADYLALVEYANKNGVDLSTLPQEVIAGIAKGQKPLEAYILYENAQLRLKAQQLEQNQKNRQKNPGRMSADAPAKVSDPFDDAFADVFGI